MKRQGYYFAGDGSFTKGEATEEGSLQLHMENAQNLKENKEKAPESKETRHKKEGKSNQDDSFLTDLLSALVPPITLIYMEAVMNIWSSGGVSAGTLSIIVILSFAIGFGMSAVSCIFTRRGRKWVVRALLFILGFLFAFHSGYFNIFHTWFSWRTIGQAGEVTAFWREAVISVLEVVPLIVAFFVPFVLHCLFGRKLYRGNRRLSPLALSALLTAFSSLASYCLLNDEVFSMLDLDQNYTNYGVITTTWLEAKEILFGGSSDDIEYLRGLSVSELYESEVDEVVSDSNVEYGYNAMDIDFEAAADSTSDQTLKAMDEYFSSLPTAQKNEYTGMFEGKNLIFLTLESFSTAVIDPEQTPLLYKMATEGFVFNNYYIPFWGGSTATGEYSNLTGNFYTTADCLSMSADTYQPFSLGQQFSELGYLTLAYHNNSYTYYDRDESLPNFGYTYKGIGNGLVLASKQWPNSDYEMAVATADEYIGTGESFHVYYMTMSGHGGYLWTNNAMSALHESDLLDKYDNADGRVRAYLACQYEVELMLEYLVERLDEAGILEDTVFVMTSDHYPYLIGDSSLAKLYGLESDGLYNNLELYQNSLILWCADMEEPVVVDVPCSSIDILPTISNLFGLEYDSRLMTGVDILSDSSEHIAILKIRGWSWLTEQGYYFAGDGSFTKSGRCTMAEDEVTEYVERINKIVKLKTTYSPKILEKNYYKHIFLYDD